MAKKKACKSCRMFVEGDECPICKTSSFTTSWQGRLHVLDSNRSFVAKKVHLESKGEYAIKIR